MQVSPASITAGDCQHETRGTCTVSPDLVHKHTDVCTSLPVSRQSISFPESSHPPEVSPYSPFPPTGGVLLLNLVLRTLPKMPYTRTRLHYTINDGALDANSSSGGSPLDGRRR